jgi:hypothetical protein
MGMGLAGLASGRPRRDRLTLAGGFTPAGRRVRAERSPPPTLGEIIEAVACETENDAVVVAVVVHLFRTRKIQWAGSSVHDPPDGRVTAFE